jgi:hypothetical protein
VDGIWLKYILARSTLLYLYLLFLAVAMLVWLNILATRALKRSDAATQEQKNLQLALTWLVPLSALLVLHFHRAPPARKTQGYSSGEGLSGDGDFSSGHGSLSLGEGGGDGGCGDGGGGDGGGCD